MKHLFFAIALLLSASCFAQYKTTDTKRNITFSFWQYTTYSSYAGYLMKLENDNSYPITAQIVSTAINVDTTVYLAANSFEVYQLGFDYVAAGNPYIVGLRFDIDILELNQKFWVETDDSYLTGVANIPKKGGTK